MSQKEIMLSMKREAVKNYLSSILGDNNVKALKIPREVAQDMLDILRWDTSDRPKVEKFKINLQKNYLNSDGGEVTVYFEVRDGVAFFSEASVIERLYRSSISGTGTISQTYFRHSKDDGSYEQIKSGLNIQILAAGSLPINQIVAIRLPKDRYVIIKTTDKNSLENQKVFQKEDFMESIKESLKEIFPSSVNVISLIENKVVKFIGTDKNNFSRVIARASEANFYNLFV